MAREARRQTARLAARSGSSCHDRRRRLRSSQAPVSGIGLERIALADGLRGGRQPVPHHAGSGDAGLLGVVVHRVDETRGDAIRQPLEVVGRHLRRGVPPGALEILDREEVVAETPKPVAAEARSASVGGPDVIELAEREGFEPSVEGLPLHVISSHADSTTLASLRLSFRGMLRRIPRTPSSLTGVNPARSVPVASGECGVAPSGRFLARRSESGSLGARSRGLRAGNENTIACRGPTHSARAA